MAEHETPEKDETREDEILEETPADEDAPTDEAEAAEPESEDETTVLTRERDDYKDRWMRAVAEQENLRRRTRRDVEEAHVFATADLVRPLLEVLDDFERAEASLADAPEDGEGDAGALASYRDGVRLVHERLQEVLNRKGVERIEAGPGDAFDPEVHEAVAQLPSEDVEEGAVMEVVQAGYRYRERTLRAARVVVAR